MLIVWVRAPVATIKNKLMNYLFEITRGYQQESINRFAIHIQPKLLIIRNS